MENEFFFFFDEFMENELFDKERYNTFVDLSTLRGAAKFLMTNWLSLIKTLILFMANLRMGANYYQVKLLQYIKWVKTKAIPK